MNKTIVVIALLFFLNSVASFLFQPAVLALMIPIVVILSFSPIGKALAALITGKSVNTYSLFSFSKNEENEIHLLKEKYNNLEKKMYEYEEEMSKMREMIIFSDNKKLSFQNNSTENIEEQPKKKIDLTKNRNLENR